MPKFSPNPIYLSERQVAELLGYGIDWLRRHAAELERQFGFPGIDPAIGKRHRPSIEAWASERNNRSRKVDPPRPKPTQGNINAF